MVPRVRDCLNNGLNKTRKNYILSKLVVFKTIRTLFYKEYYILHTVFSNDPEKFEFINLQNFWGKVYINYKSLTE